MNKNDLRYQKTEDALKAAMLKLLETKNPDQFSITDLCALARCSRNAFYQHYPGKYDLYESILKSITEDLRRSCMPVVDSLDLASEEKITEWTHQLLDAVYSRRSEIISFMKNGTSFFDILRGSLYEAMWKNNLHFVSQDQITREIRLILYYSANGVAGFIQYWLCETDFSLDKAKEYLDMITKDGFRQVRDLMRKSGITDKE